MNGDAPREDRNAHLADEYHDRFLTARELLRGGLSPEDAAELADLPLEQFVDALDGEPEDIRGEDARTGDVLADERAVNSAMYALADELSEGDRVRADVEFTRVPGGPVSEPELEMEVDHVKVSDRSEDPPRLDVLFTQVSLETEYAAYERGQKWRGTFGEPYTRGELDHGDANLYRGDEWGMNTGVFSRLERVRSEGDDSE